MRFSTPCRLCFKHSKQTNKSVLDARLLSLSPLFSLSSHFLSSNDLQPGPAQKGRLPDQKGDTLNRKDREEMGEERERRVKLSNRSFLLVLIRRTILYISEAVPLFIQLIGDMTNE